MNDGIPTRSSKEEDCDDGEDATTARAFQPCAQRATEEESFFLVSRWLWRLLSSLARAAGSGYDGERKIEGLKLLYKAYVSYSFCGGRLEDSKNISRIPLVNSKMESSKSKWQVRAWMDTLYIVHMNCLLQSRHVRRIAETPFKYCLGIIEPIDLNLKLLKQLVRRWVPQHQSFRVRQQLVSFDVVDVVMTLGLGVGGLDISFDESIVRKVGELFNSSKTKAKELITMFDKIVGDDDLDVDVVCRLCNKKLLTGKIADSISISGSVVVLQLWVYERLGLHSHSSCKVFPRLKRFRSLNYGTEAIDLLFRKGEVHFDWYLRSVERHNPIIRRAFNMDAVVRTEEAPEKGENSCESARAARLEKALSERRKTGNFHQNIPVDEAGVNVVGEGNEGGVQEAVVDDIVADEADADEVAFGETAGDEDGVHEEETAAAPVDEAAATVAAVHEATVDEQPVHEAVADEQVVDEAIADEDVVDELRPQDPPAFVDIGGDDEDDQLIPHVQSLLVEPLTTILGDLTTRVDLEKLYHFMARKDIVVSYVCEIMGQLLTTRDCSSLGPRECVDNMVLIFAATMFMYFEKRSTGVIKRMIFSPMFATHFLIDNKRRVANRHVWQLIDYQPYFRHDLVRVQDLLSADWVFIPVVSNNHWWCYALKVCTMKFFVIDSLDKGIRGRGGIDRSIAKIIQRFWGLLTNTYEDSKIAFNVEQAKIPVQPNTYDFGVIMMKALEIWDEEDKYDGKSMPDYSNEELTAFRMRYICDWILDAENLQRLGVLQHFGLV
ncbi:uncharacterized protein LOC106754791 [Vigna radiata var. radiata]|uniref:Uncharacterized protein LOC106754791 n=1 Tax=Vigna radiata var. radiata TaxID=3916 RepID=A0A1S3TEZ8_VIGRR|nr:uncharacterized protein LOC106754791 [Vigna radiata var. radiata]